MRTALAIAFSAGAILAAALTPAAGSAATLGPAAATSRAAARGGSQEVVGNPTTVTFTVSSGALSMSAPASASLGSAAPGGTASGSLGTVTVTDLRALLATYWGATAAASTFVTGGGTGNQVVAASAVTYTPGTVTTTGTVTATPTTITMSSIAQTVVAGTSASGNNTASWNPTIAVVVPAQAVGGTYTGTITQSVA
jgi:hypothetical protein